MYLNENKLKINISKTKAMIKSNSNYNEYYEKIIIENIEFEFICK